MSSPTDTVTTQASSTSAAPSSITGAATINARPHPSTTWTTSMSLTPSPSPTTATATASTTISTASRPPCSTTTTTSSLNACNPHWSNGRWAIYGFLFGIAILGVMAGLFYITLHCRERRRRNHDRNRRRHNRRGRRGARVDESLIAGEEACSAQPIAQVQPAYHSSRAWGLGYGCAVGL